MTTVDETKTHESQMTDVAPESKTVAKKNTTSRKRKATSKPSMNETNEPGAFEVRVDDSGTVMPSFWRFGE